MNLSRMSQFDLYFFCNDATPLIEANAALVGPVVAPTLGDDWFTGLVDATPLYRMQVEHLIKESLETSEAVRLLEQYSRQVSDWRQIGVTLARRAPKPRRDLLMMAAGWGLGSSRSVKELKDVLLTISSRLTVHGSDFVGLGMSPRLVELPARVLRKLETGAGDVAREKAEDSLARAEVTDLFNRITETIGAVWEAAELVGLQARLLAERDDASKAEIAQARAEMGQAKELLVKLEAALGEARVKARKRAETEVLPPGLSDPAPEVPADDAESAA